MNDVSTRVMQYFGAHVGGDDAKRLNLGCGRHPEPGFINLDRVGGFGADVVFDLERCGEPAFGLTRIPFEANTFDCVLASHVLEHIRNLIPLMRDIHRVLKPGGKLCIASPYASSDDAWEDPTHVRAFTEMSWHYFNRRLYEKKGHGGSYPSDVDFEFGIVNVSLVARDDIANLPDLDSKKRFMRNIIKEMQAVLRKVE